MGKIQLWLRTLTWLILVVSGHNTRSFAAMPSPAFHWDLRSYGYPIEAGGRTIGNFTDLNFLSNDLVLVTINQRVYQAAAEPTNLDQPQSKLMLFDISRQHLVKLFGLAVEKDSGSVKATNGGRFVVLAESGLRLCSIDLECFPPVPTTGPVYVSPQGLRLLVGGNGKTDRILLDSSSMKEIGRFPWNSNSLIMPGDRSLLVQRENLVYLRLAGEPDHLLPFALPKFRASTQFLNDEYVAIFDADDALLISRLDHKSSYYVHVLPWWDGTNIAAASSGSRFLIHESGYTRWNAIIHFYDIESSRPRDMESVRILDTSSGEELFQLSWDPRPYVGYPVVPAISPNGRRIALIRHGSLEIYEID